MLLTVFDGSDKFERRWQVSSGDPTRNWSVARLSAFEMAVEKRAAWLYEVFYNDLNFSGWRPK